MPTATLTRPTQTAGATATDGLPRANVHSGDFGDEFYVNLRDVPVFAEHETTLGKDQQQVKFGLDELRAICNRCNQRIRETGDYATVTLGHTPSPEAHDQGAPMPEVVGYAGPFRIGVLGNEGQRQRYAILADFHMIKEDWPRVRKKFARRSPEVWVEDRVDQMFLDPIALLGAEAPRLDMGLMLYSAQRAGKRIEKYAVVSPGPMNTFVPNHDVIKKDAAGQPPTEPIPPANEVTQMDAAATPQLVEQIVEAIDKLPWALWCKQKMAEEQGPGAGAAAPGEGTGEPAAPAPAGAGAARPAAPEWPPAPPPTPKKEPEKLAATGEGSTNFPPEPKKMASGAGDGSADDEDKAEREEYSRLKAHYAADEGHKRYSALKAKYESKGDAAMWAQVDDAGGGRSTKDRSYNEEEMEGNWHEKMSADDKEEYARLKSRYSALRKKYSSGDADSEYREVPEGGTHETKTIPPGDMKVETDKTSYSAEGSAGGTSPEKPASSTVDPGVKTPPAASAENDPGKAATHYARNGDVERYRREAEATKTELGQVRQQLQVERESRINNERYSRLQSMRMGLSFDIEKSFSLMKYGKMSDEDFLAHCDLIENTAPRIPIGSDLPYDAKGSAEAAAAAPDRPGGRAQLGKYSKAQSDQALKICVERRMAGKDVIYEDVVQALHDGRQPNFPD